MFKLVRCWCVFALLTVVAGVALAQKGEIGGGAGGSIYVNRTVTGPAGSASVGHSPNFAAGGWIGHNSANYVGGEIRYLFEKNALKVSSGGTKVTFSGQSHAVHYDVLLYGAPKGARVRPYAVVGGGIKGYRGTGKEQALQPLVQFAALTRTHEWKGLVTFGGGVKVQTRERMVVRVEFRDYLTPFPKEVIAPTGGSRVSGWLHNFVPLVGVSYSF